jgi:hypothetical protein
VFSSRTPFPGTAALLPVAGTVALVLAGAWAPGRGVAHVLNASVLQRLGKLSYSWYLWHWPALVFARAAVPDLSLGARVAVALGSLGLAAVTYALVENPLRASPPLVARPRLSLALAGALTGVCILLAGGWYLRDRAVIVRPDNLYARAADDMPRVFDDGCLQGAVATRPRPCIAGDTTAQTTVVLLGDSHAAQWFPALDAAARARGWRLVSFLKATCPAVGVATFNPYLGRMYDECTVWRAEALREAAALRPAVIVLGSWQSYVSFAEREGLAGPTVDDWQQGTRRTLRAATASGAHAVVIRDAPSPGFDVPVCLARHAHRPDLWRDTCAFRREDGLDAAVARAEQVAVHASEGASVVDFSDRFCGPELCPPAEDGVVFYMDEDHLTATASARLADAFADRLAPLMTAQKRRLERAGS